MKTRLHSAHLPFLSRLMLAWQLRHHWQLKQAFPRCYWTVRWAWHHTLTAVSVCRIELMPALSLTRTLSVSIRRYWRLLVRCISKHAGRHHRLSNRVG